ncbi:peroxisomal 2 4-dienoyl-CoA reductase sps19 [Friedmanniomyces endolithicus]|uniref:2,4-dienoyl-CoA reductase [(3E)-enoyl-CoA-producing] n=1 Tax=Friedmanniomyces endolithicus TaxID=329885 RepID=A0AAN6H2T5_9PEZI|nr:peroxisomal 2 4-dienoyl-CoA reductase sps19 [Friedmanniomyces endolithicus]KAK0950651.1 peroxisomal 2 4-dienoyl-CoA reductase sps19 [Friedmanniomyces endolithicus]KAK0951468.1 peroxisomal 2 4-dienoyl-CoA reductase sps19 [Friedmanniomyces endolithicus]KAK1021733.1 peroxisomal 2 4-dienoyl-CoA reductase sps19 [Friedmanniomyces endolithicus]
MPVPRETFLSNVWREGILKDKVLFCTGGAGIICSMQVRVFVALGGNACITGRNAEKTEKGAADIASVRPGAKVIGIVADVRDMKAMDAAAERCATELALSSNAFKTVMEIDTLGSFHTAKAVLPYLAQSVQKHKNSGKAEPTGTGGRIIFISASFHFRGQPLQAHAMAAKAAVDQISSSVAMEYGPHGITSNVITPGPIAGTEGLERLSESDERSVKKSKAKIPVGRWGEVKEIADATVFLFSDAGSYVNGHVLVVDGGQWRTTSADMRSTCRNPDFFLLGATVEGVKVGKKSKL